MAQTQPLSVYLLKDTIVDPSAAIRPNGGFIEIVVPAGFDGILKIYKRSSMPHGPKWLHFFPQVIQNSFGATNVSSAGSVVFVASAGRILAICFGTGWHLLKKESFVRCFGLYAALGLLKDETIRAVDISTYEDFAKYRKVSTSKGTGLSNFDIEGQLDLLRGVVGKCAKKSLGSQIGGRDPCVIWTKLPFESLPQLGRMLVFSSQSKKIEKKYPILRNIAVIKDPTEIARLDALLNLHFQAGGSAYMAPPDVIDWDNVAGFRFHHTNAPEEPVLDISFTDIVSFYAPDVPTLHQLRQLDVQTVKPDGMSAFQRWSTYDCLIVEILDPLNAAKKCILMAGEWYAVDVAFAGKINSIVQAIPNHVNRILPDALSSEIEKTYNKRFANGDAVNLVNLDAKNISYGGGRSRIEVCDVLSSDGCLYHIKDYSGSATLSHLFAQGTVSARLILEADFRAEIRNKFGIIAQNVVPQASINPSQLEVVFGIICQANMNIPIDLPFFAKVRLVDSVMELKRMGFTKVSTIKISRI